MSRKRSSGRLIAVFLVILSKYNYWSYRPPPPPADPLGSLAPSELERDRCHDVTRLLQPRRLDKRDRVARRVQDDVAPEDDRRWHAALRECRLIAAAPADRLERHAERPRRRADPLDERCALVGCLERVAAAADDVEVQVRDEAFDAPWRHGHARGIGLRAQEPFLFPGPSDKDDGAPQLRALRNERACDLDRDGGTGRVVVRGREDGPVGIGADSVEVSANEDRAF